MEKSGALELKFRSAKNKLTKKQNKTILQFILKAAKYPVIINNVGFFWGGKHPSESLAGHTRLVLIIKLSPSATGINITVMFVVTLRLRIFFFFVFVLRYAWSCFL